MFRILIVFLVLTFNRVGYASSVDFACKTKLNDVELIDLFNKAAFKSNDEGEKLSMAEYRWGNTAISFPHGYSTSDLKVLSMVASYIQQIKADIFLLISQAREMSKFNPLNIAAKGSRFGFNFHIVSSANKNTILDKKFSERFSPVADFYQYLKDNRTCVSWYRVRGNKVAHVGVFSADINGNDATNLLDVNACVVRSIYHYLGFKGIYSLKKENLIDVQSFNGRDLYSLSKPAIWLLSVMYDDSVGLQPGMQKKITLDKVSKSLKGECKE